MTDTPERHIAARNATRRTVSTSPFGPGDEIGMLNLITPESRSRILAEADPATAFDLSVEYFIGMPSFVGAADPGFHIWMSHTPSGSVLDDRDGIGEEQSRLISYSGDCIMMYTHCGTHIDSLNHFGYCGRIWNGFNEREHLGSRSWTVCGPETYPPIIARGVLIDVAAAHGHAMLPDSYGIGRDDLRMALARQQTSVRPGDVVLIRTGRMTIWDDPQRYLADEPGLTREGAKYLAEAGAIVIGADNVALEQDPTPDTEDFQAVHAYLLAEAGVPIVEVLNLEALAAAELYEFAFLATAMPIRGATGAPLRPIVFPLRSGS